MPFRSSETALFPSDSPAKIVQHVIDALDGELPQDSESVSDADLDKNLSPVFALLSSFYEAAPDTVKGALKERILPSEE